MDPSRERPRRPRPQLARRDVLRGGAWLAAGAATVPLLSACRDQIPAGTATGEAPWPLARPNDPVELEIADDNQPIDDGLPPESGGTFNILNYADFMGP